MTMAFVARRMAVPVLAVLLAALATLAQAQDPRAVSVQGAARDWLVIADSLDGVATWNAAGKKFKEAISADEWGVALRKARAPMGALQQRTMLATTFDAKSPAGGPDGEFALVLFRTAYANKVDSSESVTLEREADGSWRVIGYFIR
jgi:hypothetical protein